MKEISVIIPAQNCADALKRCLGEFRAQTVARDRFEIIVIDDCSDDALAEAVRPFVDEGFVTVLRNPRKMGVAATRNRGLDAARGDIVLFFDGDNVPVRTCLEEHLASHRLHPEAGVAVLGNIAHPADIALSPLMLLDDLSATFASLEDGRMYDWRYFATTHISLKRRFVDIGFNCELFNSGSGLEDTEFGFRLSRKGLQILYNARAVSYHYHFRSPGQYLAKVYRYGAMLKRWIDADAALRSEKEYIAGYVPFYSPRISVRLLKYLVCAIFINDLTAGAVLALARRCEHINEKMSVFLYRRLYNYIFACGFSGRQIFGISTGR